MISLLKNITDDWKKSWGSLLEDLQHLEAAINQRWSATFGDTNTNSVATGGTGVKTLTAHGVLVGEGTAAIHATTPGATKTVLAGTGSGADPAFTSAPEVLSMVVDNALTADGTTLVVDSTNHRVGIKTATPSQPLEVVGNAVFDTTTLFVDATNHRVGIGTLSPTSLETISANPNGALPTPLAGTVLHIGGADGTTDRVQFDAFGANGLITFRRADGILTAPTAVQTGEALGAIGFHGFGTAYTTSRAQIAANAAEVWTGTNQGTYIFFSTTLKGAAGQTEKVRIDDAGNLGIGTSGPTQKLEVNGGAVIDSPTFFVDSANHRVGVGTISPAVALHVKGAELRMQGDAFFFSLYNTAGTRRGYVQVSEAAEMSIVQDQAQPLRLYTSDVMRVDIDGAGSVITLLEGESRLQKDSCFYSFYNTAGVQRGYIQISEAGDMTILQAQAQPIKFYTNSALALTIASGGNLSLVGAVASIGGIVTSGVVGVSAVRASGRSAGAVAAVASVATYTVGAADGTFKVSANVLVTTATLHSFNVTVTYTDQGGTSRTTTLNFSTVAGVISNAAITQVAGAVPYEGVDLTLRCKAATAITIATTGTFTTVVYDVDGSIIQVA